MNCYLLNSFKIVFEHSMFMFTVVLCQLFSFVATAVLLINAILYLHVLYVNNRTAETSLHKQITN